MTSVTSKNITTSTTTTTPIPHPTSPSSTTSFFAEIRRMSSEDDHDLREEARNQPSLFDSIAPDFYSPPALTHHVDYQYKTQRRKLELDALRTKQLAKPRAARLQTAAPPKDTLLDSFEERQRRWVQEDRLERSMALESLHKFQANDKEVVYLGTPEKTKTRRSSDQDHITPDATASIYHSPHHLVVLVQGGDDTNSHRTYTHHPPPPHESSSCSPSSTPSSPPASPDKSEIPMSSLMQVARTLLMKEEDEVEDIPDEDMVDQSLPSQRQDEALIRATNNNEGPSILNVPSNDSEIMPPCGAIAILPFRSSRAKDNNTSTTTEDKAATTTISGEFSMIGEAPSNESAFPRMKPSRSSPESEPQPSASDVKASDRNEKPTIIIPKPSSFELESFASLGIAILPVMKTKISNESENLQPKQSEAETPDENLRGSMLSKPPARKVSEGSHFDVENELRESENKGHMDEEVAGGVKTMGSYDDVLQSFASFGVAILPTVSRSRDEDDAAPTKTTSTATHPSIHVQPLNGVADAGLLQQTMEWKHDIRDDEEDEMKEVDTSSVFRPLISPSIQNRVDELASKAAFLGPVALPVTSKDMSLPRGVAGDVQEVDATTDTIAEHEVREHDQTTEEDMDLPSISISTQDVGHLQAVRPQGSNLQRNKGAAQVQQLPIAGTAVLPTSTFLSFPWSTSIMPAAW